MDVGYADNAGAITCHLIGDEKFFDFVRSVKSSLKSAYFWCVDFRDPTAFSRFNCSDAMILSRTIKSNALRVG